MEVSDELVHGTWYLIVGAVLVACYHEVIKEVQLCWWKDFTDMTGTRHTYQ